MPVGSAGAGWPADAAMAASKPPAKATPLQNDRFLGPPAPPGRSYKEALSTPIDLYFQSH